MSLVCFRSVIVKNLKDSARGIVGFLRGVYMRINKTEVIENDLKNNHDIIDRFSLFNETEEIWYGSLMPSKNNHYWYFLVIWAVFKETGATFLTVVNIVTLLLRYLNSDLSVMFSHKNYRSRNSDRTYRLLDLPHAKSHHLLDQLVGRHTSSLNVFVL